jgi:hypothetical protein
VTPNHSVASSRKQWYDRLADAILGDEDAAPASPSSRYALICEKCFAHNGLVKDNMWEDAREWISFCEIRFSSLMDQPKIFVEYVCPKCGHFNQSARVKRQRMISSPSGSANASPAAANAIERQHSSKSSPSPKSPTSDLPTVDTDESMSMVVDAEQPNSPKTS